MDSGTHGLWGGEAVQPSQGTTPHIVYESTHVLVMKRFVSYKLSVRRKAVSFHTKLQISYSFILSQCAERLAKTPLSPKRWKSMCPPFCSQGLNLTIPV